MDPNKIQLSNFNKLFEYEKIAREIDSCDDIDYIKNMLKSYIKLYMKQQEVLTEMKVSPNNTNQ